MSMNKLFDMLFNRLLDRDGYASRHRTLFSRDDVEYIIELADAYSDPADAQIALLRSVLERVDAGYTSASAVGETFGVGGQFIRQRISKAWRMIQLRARCAVRAAELGRGFIVPAPKVVRPERRSVANAWIDGYNFARTRGGYHGIEMKPI